ncbi:KTSC domain-containing protein [Janthinobacterium aestuarii]
MRIQFQQGHSYDFCRVPPNVHTAFMAAYSKGSYYNLHIKDRYQC